MLEIVEVCDYVFRREINRLLYALRRGESTAGFILSTQRKAES